MKNAVILVLGLFVIGFLATAAFAQEEPAGKKLFLDNKCNMCHSVESASIEKKSPSAKGPDLSNAGAKDAAWIAKWMGKEVDVDGKKHPVATKLSDPDLKTLVDWLATLKKK